MFQIRYRIVTIRELLERVKVKEYLAALQRTKKAKRNERLLFLSFRTKISFDVVSYGLVLR